MQRKILSFWITLASIPLFHLFFWQEEMGLNTLWFAGLMIAALFYLYPQNMRHRSALLLAGGTLLTAIWVVVHHSTISMVVHVLSFATLVGMCQQRELRFLWYGFLLGCWSALATPAKLWHNWREQFAPNFNFSKIISFIRLGFIPLIILFAFHQVYYFANPHFAELSTSFWSQFAQLLTLDISWPHFFFILLGTMICGGILLPVSSEYFRKREAARSEDIERCSKEERLAKRRRRKEWGIKKYLPTLGLKYEYRAGLLLLYSLNLLLLLVNFTDLRYVWFGFSDSELPHLKNFVHEGTYLLIVAILLAMMVLAYFFRNNLNFFPDEDGWLRRGAYLWIGQNVLLTFSVGVRNYHYIDYHGLAYLRIGVLLFLLLVLYGLWTMYLKVRDRKSLFFLLRRNAWALYLVLLLASSINWDIWITRYNLNTPTKGAIDVRFLLYGMSDKNIFLLQDHLEHLSQLPTYPAINTADTDYFFQLKKESFEQRTHGQGWPSWNWPDYRNRQFLSTENKEK